MPPAIIFAMDLCGADVILNLGGVQGVAAMASGLFGLPKADILVGPGNQYVAEAKRILYGQVGIDMFAGPTDSMVVADASADPEMVAYDLVGQAEHGYNSPVWLVASDRTLADRVMALVPGLIESLPTVNRDSARAAWADFAEVILCDSAEEMARVADQYRARASACPGGRSRLVAVDGFSPTGRCFSGKRRRSPSATRHRDRTMCCRHRGRHAIRAGLSVHKFMKTVTWQRATRAAARPLAEATARISRLEGMEGHARSADIRLAKFFPGDVFDLGTSDAVP